MSLNGINSNPLLSSLGPLVRPGATPASTNGASAGTAGVTPSAGTSGGVRERAAVVARPSIATAPSSVPLEAPAGTDPALWSVLTSEERTFFSKTAALGPLTYGKIKNAALPTPPAMRGGRLDVRA
jgi:hypothetical protein